MCCVSWMDSFTHLNVSQLLDIKRASSERGSLKGHCCVLASSVAYRQKLLPQRCVGNSLPASNGATFHESVQTVF